MCYDRWQRFTCIALRITCPQGNNISNSARSVWDKDPSSTRRPRSGPTCGNSSPSGGISINIITVVTYTTSRPATTSPRIRLAVPAPTPTTPTRPHRRLPVHTSGLPAAPRLIRIATSAVPNTAVSSDLLAYSLLSACASPRKLTRYVPYNTEKLHHRLRSYTGYLIKSGSIYILFHERNPGCLLGRLDQALPINFEIRDKNALLRVTLLEEIYFVRFATTYT